MAKNYKIGFLGISGEGKTIYLSSIYFMLENRFYPDAHIVRNKNVDYLTEACTIIGTRPWEQILPLIAGTVDIDQVSFDVNVKGNQYNLSFIDYRGGEVYHNEEMSQELLNKFQETNGLIIMVSESNFNHNTQNFNMDWVQSIQKVYSQIGKKPSVLVMTQGDITQDKLGDKVTNIETWFRNASMIFKANMEQYVGDFDIFIRSSKNMIDSIRLGRGDYVQNLRWSMSDLGEPLFALLNRLDLHSSKRGLFNLLNSSDDWIELAEQNLRSIESLRESKIDVQPFFTDCSSVIDSMKLLNKKKSAFFEKLKGLNTIEEINEFGTVIQDFAKQMESQKARTDQILEYAKSSPDKKDNSLVKYLAIFAIIIFAIFVILKLSA